MNRRVDRFVRRGASLLSLPHLARPVQSWIDGRIMLTCRSCSEKPDTVARLEEIAAVEWN